MTRSAHHIEMLDVVDEFGNHVGTKSRHAVHEDGDWHQVFHCQVVADRNGVATAILQERSSAKAAFPGLLDISATGHLDAGETPLDGRRELAEELGVEVEADDLTPIGIRRLVDNSGEGRWNRELTHVFLLRDDRPIDHYRFDPHEVSAVWEVPIRGLLGMLDGGPAVRSAGWRIDDGHLTTASRSIGGADLVPGFDYWVTLMVMAERFHQGVGPLAI